MEYASGGDLHDMLDAMGALPESWARRWFAEMLCAVLTLHGIESMKVLGIPESTVFYENISHNSSLNQQ